MSPSAYTDIKISRDANHFGSPIKVPYTSINMQIIPELLAHWPWPRAINPLYEEVSKEASCWFQSFKLFTPQSQHALDRGDSSRIAAMAVPHGSRDHLRSCMDYMHVLFTIDEYTDKQPPSTVRALVDSCLAIMHHDGYYDCPTVFDEFFAQFWRGAMDIATPQSAKQLASTVAEYLDGTYLEAEGMASDEELCYERYLQVRLGSIGVRGFYAFCGLPLSIPDAVFQDPLFIELQYCGSELMLLDNDIISYNRERATCIAKFNAITVTMDQLRITYADAVEWLMDRIAQLEQRYMELHEDFMTRPYDSSTVREDVLQLLDLMGNLRAANYYWSFEGGRYFGLRGEETRKTHRCPMAPVQPRNWELRGEHVEVLLMDDALEQSEILCK
ncbi:terpenoid synthase [Cubamyces sp. BRFM 1775]|nr:terpenoid synthase [Cubamyces sp. BRFM 1775]